MQRLLPLLINKTGGSGTKRRAEGYAQEAMGWLRSEKMGAMAG